MYDISYFKASSEREVVEFMRAHPFVVLCGVDQDGKPVATHIPVLLEERNDRLYILAHVMRKQLHTEAYMRNPQVLAIFYGAHTYVSASWYENKQVASTWNYQAVHASGTLRFLGDEELLQILSRLTEHFENNPASPALVGHMDKEYLDRMMRAIVAFEIEVQEVQHVFKLSQNHSEKNVSSITGHLQAGDAESRAVAEEMIKEKERNQINAHKL